MPRCTICRRHMQYEYVEMPRIGTDNKPVQYRNVRRYFCPEGCRGVRLDFSQARPASSGVLTKVAPQVKPLQKKPDFNDRVLAVGLIIGYMILVAGVLAIETTLGLKIAAVALLTLSLYGTYRFATQRVVLPNYFPVPLSAGTPEMAPRPEPQAQVVPQPAQQPVAAQPAAASAAASTPTAPAEAPAGGGIAMKVTVGGEVFELDISSGENMLDAALNRNVDLDFSCLEGLCDSCEVKVLSGSENISAPTQEEFDMLGEDEVKSGKRLSCQVVVNGPVSIEQ